MPVRYIKRNSIFLILVACLFSLKVYSFPILVDENQPSKEQTKSTEIKIGLLINDSTNYSAQHAAKLAIREVNKNSENIHFKLIVRSVEGRWGSGTKESVKLVYEDDVWAMVGSLDGRNAHLIEQVATKAHTIFLSTWATDPTLSQAFIPWYFRCIPNDLQQAKVLIDEIYHIETLNKTTVVSDKSYDANLSAKTFIKEHEKKGKNALEFKSLENTSSKTIEKNISDLIASNTENLVLFGNSETINKITKQVKSNNFNCNIYGTIALAEQTTEINFQKYLEGAKIVSPNYYFTEEGKIFQEKFFETYNYMPGPRAAYAFDGINLIIEAIYNSGFNKEKIKNSLRNINYTNGVTGSIQFDKMGNRIETGRMIKIIEGKPALIRNSD